MRVYVPSLRGTLGQPGAWSFFYDEVDDVLAAAEYLSQQPYVDANRLFIAGHSNGGTLTLLAALAKRRGIDVEVVEIEGDHITHVPQAIMQSIVFFQSISP